MKASQRDRVRAARDLAVRERTGNGRGSSNDSSLNRVVWLPSVRAARRPSIFQAQYDYEGRVAA